MPHARTKGWIWPKDPRPGRPLKWRFGSRFKDVMTNKGPDIYVGNLDGPVPVPRSPSWSRWKDLYGTIDDDGVVLLPLFPWDDRGGQRYDYRTRKYTAPNINTWSNVRYRVSDEDNGHLDTTQLVWDGQGNMYPFNQWHPWQQPPTGHLF